MTVEDGMPHSEVNAITSDRDGFIWFGTYNGIARYDGYSLASITKDEDKSLRVISLYCDRDKDLLFIGTEGNGLKIMDLNANKKLLLEFLFVIIYFYSFFNILHCFCFCIIILT